MDLKKYQTRKGWESLKNPVLRNDPSPLSGHQGNALASLLLFLTYTTKRTRDASALCWRSGREPALSRSAGLLRLSHPRLVNVLLSGPSLLKVKLFQKLSPLASALLEGCQTNFQIQLVSPPSTASQCRQICLSLETREPPLLTTEHDITLQTKAFIPSDETASAIHLRIRHHTVDKHIYLSHKCVLHWRRTRWKRKFELQPHTHTQLATHNFKTEHLSRWLL